jgi:iron complex outermembrane receptor protein
VAHKKSTADEDVGLEEVTVTAERTTSTVQRIAIAIPALSGEQLVNQGVHNASDLTGKIPNVNIANNAGAMTVSLINLSTGRTLTAASAPLLLALDAFTMG